MYAEVEACAKAYEKAGFKRLGHIDVWIKGSVAFYLLIGEEPLTDELCTRQIYRSLDCYRPE